MMIVNQMLKSIIRTVAVFYGIKLFVFTRCVMSIYDHRLNYVLQPHKHCTSLYDKFYNSFLYR